MKITGIINQPNLLIAKRFTGFTLIELVITVLLMSIFMTMAAPSFTRMIQGSAALSATNRIKSSLKLGYSEAETRRQAVFMRAHDASQADNEWGVGWCIYYNSHASCDVVPKEDLIRDVILDDDNMIINSEGSTNRNLLTFSSNGSLDSGSIFYINRGDIGRQFCVRMLRFGGPRSWEIDTNNPTDANGADQCQ